MKDNYPPGAANDPDAPYNEIPPREVGIVIHTTMTKETTAFLDEGDDYREGWWKDEVEDSGLSSVLNRCEKIVKQMRREGHCYYAGVNLLELEQDCHDWLEEKSETEII